MTLGHRPRRKPRTTSDSALEPAKRVSVNIRTIANSVTSIETISSREAFCQLFLTFSFTRSGHDHISEDSWKDDIGGKFINVGLISALFLTMVVVSPEDMVGEWRDVEAVEKENRHGRALLEQLNFDVTQETSEHIHSLLMSGAFLLLLTSVMQSFYLFAMLRELHSAKEASDWLRAIGKAHDLPAMLMACGCVCFVAAKAWDCFTNLPGLWICLVPLITGLFFIIVLANVRNLQALYEARHACMP